jgi:hypothetical protein
MKPFRDTLSVRTANALWNIGLKRREDILRAIKSGRLHPSNPATRGFGAKALAEVRTALGLRVDLTVKQVYEIRCRLAYQLSVEGLHLVDIARILHLGTKENARRHIYHGRRMAPRKS